MTKTNLIPMTSYVAGAITVLIGVAILAAAVWTEAGPAITAIGIALAYAALVCWWAIKHVKKAQQPAMDRLRQQEPVVYFCAFPMAQRMFMVSTNKAENTFRIWGIQKKQPVLMAEESLSDVTLLKGRVKLALLRTVDGVTVQIPNANGKDVQLALYPDQVKAIMPALKDAALDAAIAQLRRGVRL